MNLRRPPRVAVWLLMRFVSIRENESLLGDLREEFCNGRSVGWYWRQTLTAIAVALWTGSPVSGMSRTASFAGCAISIFPFLVFLWLDVPFRSFQERNSIYAFCVLVLLTDARKLSRVRQWMASGNSPEFGRFKHQTFRWLLGYLATDLAYLLVAGWIGWIGWQGMLVAKAVLLFRQLIEMVGPVVRLRLYGRRA